MGINRVLYKSSMLQGTLFITGQYYTEDYITFTDVICQLILATCLKLLKFST